MPEQQPPAGFDPFAWRDPTAWSDPTAIPPPPAAPSDPWAPRIPHQPDHGQQPGYGEQPGYRPAGSAEPIYDTPVYGPSAYGQVPYGQPGSHGQPGLYGEPGPYGQPIDPRYGPPPGYPQGGWGAPGQAAPPAYGWPATPPRRRTGLVIGIIVAVVVVVLGGLAAIGATLGRPDKGTAANTTSHAPAGSGIAIGDGAALLGAIVTPTAAGHAQTISGTSHGVMTLDQLISLSFANDSAEKSRLTDRGFAVAAQREWINSNNVQVDIQLIQFKDAAGADEHVSNQLDAYGRDDTVTSSFDVASVPGGKGFEKSDLDSYGNRSATLIASAGNVAVLMFVFTPHDFDRSSEMSVMAKQVAALGA